MLITVAIVGTILLAVLAVLVGLELRRRGGIPSGTGWHEDGQPDE